jgi:hypothetical protein
MSSNAARQLHDHVAGVGFGPFCGTPWRHPGVAVPSRAGHPGRGNGVVLTKRSDLCVAVRGVGPFAGHTLAVWTLR